MANYAAEFTPLYIPFDYSFMPYKEYIPQVPSSLDDLRDRAPELLSITRFYREIVFMQESEADEVLSILNDKGEEAAITYLANYDYGTGSLHETPPWNKADHVFQSSKYIMAINFKLPYISLCAVEAPELFE